MRRAAVWGLAALAVALVAYLSRDAWRARDSDRGAAARGTPVRAVRPEERRAGAPHARPPAWTVVVVDGADEPLPGVHLRTNELESTTDPGLAVRNFATDAEGRVRFESDAATLEVWAPAWERKWRLVERHTLLRIPDGVPVQVEFVDARTGAPAEGGIALDTGVGTLPVAGGRVTASRAGKDVPAELEIAPPPGFATLGDAHGFGYRFSRFATRGRSVVPLWPAVRIAARFLDGDEPVEGVVVRPLVNHVRAGWGETDADGRVVFETVPDIVRQTLLLELHDDDGRWRTPKVVLTGEGGYPEFVFDRADLDPVGPAHNSAIGIGGGSSREKATGRGVLDVRVRRTDGAPASDVRVVCKGTDGDRYVYYEGRTDADGRVRFGKLPPFPCTVAVHEMGFVYAERTVTPAEDKTTHVALDEPPGWDVQVQVVDDEGEPVSFARVHVWIPHDHYVFLADGEQLLTPYTDAQGRIAIHRLPDPPVKLSAHLGSRRGHVELKQPVATVVVEMLLSGS